MNFPLVRKRGIKPNESKNMIRLVGFFDDLKLDYSNGSKLRNNVRSQAQPDEDKIVNYLNSGEFILVKPVFRFDLLSEEKKYAGTPSIRTDGIWVWANLLSYYVEEYHVVLPKEFIQHMKSNKWKMPLTLKIPFVKYYTLRKVTLEFSENKEKK